MKNKVDTYEYDANRRYSVTKGTKCAFVMIGLNDTDLKKGVPEATVREQTLNRAVRMARDAWREAFGATNFRWDEVEMLVTHTTLQVCVELRMVQ